MCGTSHSVGTVCLVSRLNIDGQRGEIRSLGSLRQPTLKICISAPLYKVSVVSRLSAAGFGCLGQLVTASPLL